MELRKILPGSPDAVLMDEVNHESFPPEELMETDMQLKLCADGALEVWTVYDAEEFVGFTTVYPGTRLAYVFFLAVHKDARSRGYGTRILQLLHDHYAGRRIVLDIEPVDPSVPDNAMRIRRKQFYLRNGFLESGYMLKYLGLSFEILYAGPGEFSLGDYREMMDGIRGVIHSCGFEVFEPEIFPIA